MSRLPWAAGSVATSALRLPSFWCGAGVWLTAAVVIPLSRPDLWAHALRALVYAAVASFLAVWATSPAPRVTVEEPRRGRAALQLVALAVIITGICILVGRSAGVGVRLDVPDSLAKSMMALQDVSQRYLDRPDALNNSGAFFVAPLAAMLALGATPRSLGFGPGFRVWRVAALCCTLPLIDTAGLLVTGRLAAAAAGTRAIDNLVGGPVFEEFLFRGALQSRLRVFLPTGWAILVQALAFAGVHFDQGFELVGRSGVVSGVAATVLLQGVMGVAYGLVFHRTGNLIAGAVFHVVFNIPSAGPGTG